MDNDREPTALLDQALQANLATPSSICVGPFPD